MFYREIACLPCSDAASAAGRIPIGFMARQPAQSSLRSVCAGRGQAFALYSDLLPASDQPKARDKALDFLLANIHGERKNHLSTGIMGTKFMLDVLSREGHADVACGMVSQTNFPSWGWMLANGATTLWEHWAISDNTYSQNHPMFGSVSQWFINWLGGIQPAPGSVGFDHILIRPQFVKDLTWVRSSHTCMFGKIVSNWRRTDGEIALELEGGASVA